MAEPIVDTLEVIQVQKQQRAVTPMALSSRQRALEAIQQQAPIGQIGQHIVVGAAMDLLLGTLALREVLDDAYTADNFFVHPRHGVEKSAQRHRMHTGDGLVGVFVVSPARLQRGPHRPRHLLIAGLVDHVAADDRAPGAAQDLDEHVVAIEDGAAYVIVQHPQWALIEHQPIARFAFV